MEGVEFVGRSVATHHQYLHDEGRMRREGKGEKVEGGEEKRREGRAEGREGGGEAGEEREYGK